MMSRVIRTNMLQEAYQDTYKYNHSIQVKCDQGRIRYECGLQTPTSSRDAGTRPWGKRQTERRASQRYESHAWLKRFAAGCSATLVELRCPAPVITEDTSVSKTNRLKHTNHAKRPSLRFCAVVVPQYQHCIFRSVIAPDSATVLAAFLPSWD